MQQEQRDGAIPAQTDNSERPEDGPQDVPQSRDVVLVPWQRVPT